MIRTVPGVTVERHRDRSADPHEHSERKDVVIAPPQWFLATP